MKYIRIRTEEALCTGCIFYPSNGVCVASNSQLKKYPCITNDNYYIIISAPIIVPKEVRLI
jgi:hypothetical protein